jgi:hypothetical protein
MADPRLLLRYARVHGVRRILLSRAASAARAAANASDERFAAALRGKAKGLREAADLIESLERNRRLPSRHRDGVAS